ncbi:MAG TPA: hypothetical protein PLK94_04590 [Alphaproteobacteria bacterium]|mgnify:FL=1|nr:hypothetical protein [Alphaproteobacteria bacterium]HOO50550.1 hypothetical protein [Alphaproteobacteria bacterium]
MIQTISRRVEKADPRMEIRKDESEYYEGNKKGGSGDNVHAMEWEDTTIVSTLALANFLTALLGPAKHSVPSETESGDEGKQKEETPEHHEPINTYISRATHAYQNTGRAVHDQNVEDPLPITTTENSESMISLGADFGDLERERMREFISDLHSLEGTGVTEISLLRTLNFLDSIEQGIEMARTTR